MSDVASAATAVLLISAPDQPGLVATVSDFVFRNGGNIVREEQYVDRDSQVFFERVEFELANFAISRDEISTAFAPIADRFAMRSELRFSDETMRIAIFVSKQPHCFFDLVSRYRDGEFLNAEIPLVVSNHPDHADAAMHIGMKYEHFPVTPETKPQQEQQILDVLRQHEIDLVVMARYMQILSGNFIQHYPSRIINIHHSFLPAFIGSNPYRQAHERGVKVIGATAHYATEDLDEGPIIDQDVMRVTHRDSVADLVRRGRDLERIVLARAVRAHVEHRVLALGHKTVVFE